jgi:hypothetical protein
MRSGAFAQRGLLLALQHGTALLGRVGQGQVQALQHPLPACAHVGQQFACTGGALGIVLGRARCAP